MNVLSAPFISAAINRPEVNRLSSNRSDSDRGASSQKASIISAGNKAELTNESASDFGSGLFSTKVEAEKRVRIIQVADSGLEITELSPYNDDTSSNTVLRNSPSSQYRSTQNLLKSESLSRQIGIDIYA